MIQTSKLAKVSYLLPLPPISSRLSKSDLERSKYHQKKSTSSVQKSDNKGKKSYI